MSSPDPARIREIISAATTFDGTAPVSEQGILDLESGAVDHRIVAVDGSVVGYAQIVPASADHPAMAEVVVDPAHRGRGIGTGLVGAVIEEGAHVWAHGNLPPAQAIAAKLNLTVARELLQMRRPFGAALPDVVVPDGVRLRTYRQGDAAEILRVNNAAFDWHPEQGKWTEADVATRMAEPWFDPAGLFVLEDAAGRLVGFHWTKVHTETTEPIGEVYVVAIDPVAQGGGFGKVLTLAGLAYLEAKGLESVLLYTEADNVAAVRLYEKLGFGRWHVDVAYARVT